MTGPAEPPARLRDLRTDDLAAALRLSRAAGWNQREEDWRFLVEHNPGRFVAAETGDQLVGTGGAAGYGGELAWVCMILVDPAHRGAGIGAALARAVVGRLGAFDSVGLDATPAGRPVYADLGFQEQRGLVRLFRAPHAGRADGGPTPGDDAAVRPLRDDDLPAVRALDRDVFGADRGALLEWARTRAPRACWIAPGHAGAPAGYALGRPGDHSFQIGPVVAATIDTGLALVRAALAETAGGRVILDADGTRTNWILALRALGFEEERPLFRMYRGRAPRSPRMGLQLAILGPEFG